MWSRSSTVIVRRSVSGVGCCVIYSPLRQPYFGLCLNVAILRPNCQSSTSWPSTSFCAVSFAALSLGQSRSRALMMCPSGVRMYARYSAIGPSRHGGQSTADKMPASLKSKLGQSRFQNIGRQNYINGKKQKEGVTSAAAIRVSSPIRPDGRRFPFDGPSEEGRHARDPAVVGKLVYGCLLPIWPTALATSSTSYAAPCSPHCLDHASCDEKKWQSRLGSDDERAVSPYG